MEPTSREDSRRLYMRLSGYVNCGRVKEGLSAFRAVVATGQIGIDCCCHR